VFTRALHSSISSARYAPSYFSNIHFNTTPYLRLILPSDLFPSGFPTKILYAFLFNIRKQSFYFTSAVWCSLHGVTSQKAVIFIATGARASIVFLVFLNLSLTVDSANYIPPLFLTYFICLFPYILLFLFPFHTLVHRNACSRSERLIVYRMSFAK
jgi:hypothetical protein